MCNLLYLSNMCYDKKRIDLKYRCRYFFLGHSQRCIYDVPCGVCEECISNLQMDYFVRMKSEYDQCIANGGMVAFPTFTYSNDKIPGYSYSYNSKTKDIDFHKVNAKTSQLPFIYSFNRKNLQRFFNSYRKYFERNGIISPFRYLVVGEYGTDERYTQRSHFHALIYYSAEAVVFMKHNSLFLDSVVLADLNKYWDYGHVSASKLGLFVNTPASCGYCAKYISKTMALLNLRRFAIFRDFIETHFASLVPDGYDAKPSIDGYFRHYLKKVGSNLYVLKSKNFGKCALKPVVEAVSKNRYDDAYQLFKQGFPYILNGETKFISYSMYYYRSLCYNIREDGTYYLNEVGKYFHKKAMEDTVDELVKHYCQIDYRLLPSDEYKFCMDFLRHTPVRQLVMYKLLARFRYLPTWTNTHTSLVKHFMLRKFHMSFNEIYNEIFSYLADNQLSTPRDPNSICFGSYFDSTQDCYHSPFNLADYDLFISICDNLLDDVRSLAAEQKKHHNDMVKYLNDINNNYIYSHLNP